jgi:hypothetical protein
MGTFKLRKYTVVLFSFLLTLIVVGLTSNIFAFHCGGFDKKQESSSITQSHIDNKHVNNSSELLYCDISNIKIKNNYYHLQKSSESSFTSFTYNSGKADYIPEQIFSSLESTNAGYSPIPILFQKESFQI